MKLLQILHKSLEEELQSLKYGAMMETIGGLSARAKKNHAIHG